MALTCAEVRRILELCGDDGHSIYAPSAFDGINAEFIDPLIHRHTSDGSLKGTIFNNATGGPVASMNGIHSLHILGHAVADLKLPCAQFGGRGFQARAYSSVLRDWLKEQ